MKIWVLTWFLGNIHVVGASALYANHLPDWEDSTLFMSFIECTEAGLTIAAKRREAWFYCSPKWVDLTKP